MKYTINFALDYDDTYTADIEFWDMFVKLARRRGHKVYIVTMREKFTKDMAHLLKLFEYKDLIFCGSSMKKDKCKSLSIHIDVWIDDQPVFIG